MNLLCIEYMLFRHETNFTAHFYVIINYHKDLISHCERSRMYGIQSLCLVLFTEHKTALLDMLDGVYTMLESTDYSFIIQSAQKGAQYTTVVCTFYYVFFQIILSTTYSSQVQ